MYPRKRYGGSRSPYQAKRYNFKAKPFRKSLGYKKAPIYKAPTASKYHEFSMTSSVDISAYNLYYNPMMICTRSPVVAYADGWDDSQIPTANPNPG